MLVSSWASFSSIIVVPVPLRAWTRGRHSASAGLHIDECQSVTPPPSTGSLTGQCLLCWWSSLKSGPGLYIPNPWWSPLCATFSVIGLPGTSITPFMGGSSTFPQGMPPVANAWSAPYGGGYVTYRCLHLRLMGSCCSPFLGRCVYPGAVQGGVAPFSDRWSGSIPWTFPYLYWKVWAPVWTRANTNVLVWHTLHGVCLSCGRLQAFPYLCCCILCLPPVIHNQWPPDGSGDSPRHIKVVVRVPARGRSFINQLDGSWGHSEGVRGEFYLGGYQL